MLPTLHSFVCIQANSSPIGTRMTNNKRSCSTLLIIRKTDSLLKYRIPIIHDLLPPCYWNKWIIASPVVILSLASSHTQLPHNSNSIPGCCLLSAEGASPQPTGLHVRQSQEDWHPTSGMRIMHIFHRDNQNKIQKTIVRFIARYYT